MQHTELTYFTTPFLYENDATVLVMQNYNDQLAVILNQTLFYPQGGGQPYDQGVIQVGDATFTVHQVRFAEGIVYHVGTMQGQPFVPGQKVHCVINQERRALHSRLHSGGHVIDLALEKLGYSLKPHKGYHFPEGPYVEYEGEDSTMQAPDFKAKLEHEIAWLIARNTSVKMECKPLEEIRKICHFVPPLPPHKPSRIVLFCLPENEGGAWGMPCGGTHVAALQQIGTVHIPKITIKKGITRISYRCV